MAREYKASGMHTFYVYHTLNILDIILSYWADRATKYTKSFEFFGCVYSGAGCNMSVDVHVYV